ncbi:hypothetical protein SMACR_07266 [Sordaria macrospora]|uniref:WGS project CABT00000000 data, contig 2.44 n=2 Tax=Sordaria macrospora TaxID=5147 RepID=F7W8B2_SORMK|nr:uncharacterized protein SMAC_07266 [Sordaria macrospora k-hell]KAA8631838.1 hypothetical protein SMACR_07266 [Sordaria macrospora]WPJ62700.1 hypothetical protein SMAC4_07266 [Sordaria macrospora]CCC13757.1 unnamed protein product [Sordaria macrospora k-hell]
MMDLDNYSDEDLDDILDGETINQLETHAILFTQKQAQSTQHEPQRPPPQSAFQLPAGTAEQPHYISDDDDDDGEVIDQAAQPLRAVPSIAGQQRLNHQKQQQQQQQANQQRYGQQPAFRPPNPQFTPSQHPRGPLGAPGGRALPPSQFVRPQQPPQPRPAPITRPYVGQQPPTTQGLRGASLDAEKEKEEQIRALEAELSNLRTQLTTAKGEANLIRSKYDRDVPQLRQKMAEEKARMAEEKAKMERKLQEAHKVQQVVSNELKFANADLQERGRPRTKKAVGKDGGAMTPGGRNKTKFMHMLDGFSDVEVLGVGSPSRDRAGRREQKNGGTPTKGKRKRPAVDSPSFALEMETDDGSFETGAGLFALRSSSTRSGGPSLPYDFLKLVLDHSPLPSLPLTFEAFARFCFPSKPSASFASIIFRRLPQLGVSNLINSSDNDPFRLLVDFSELLLDLWQQCLSERYHLPIYYLAALLHFILQLNAVDVAPRITSSLVPVVVTTCQLVALPRLSLKMVNERGGTVEDLEQHANPAMRKLAADIDVTQCLKLLYLCAVGCLKPPSVDQHSMPSPQAQFWKTMDLEFVVLMLSAKQPEQDWRGMLRLLRTSVMPASVGPLPKSDSSVDSNTTLAVRSRPQVQSPGSGSGSHRGGNRAGQMLPPPLPHIRNNNIVDNPKSDSASTAQVIIDCVSSYLVDTPPRWASSGSAREVSIKLAAMETLMSFASSSFGLLQLAKSDVAIPKIVSALCWAIDGLYDSNIPSESFGKLSITGADDNIKKGGSFLSLAQAQGQANNRKNKGHGYDDSGMSTPQLLSQLISRSTKLVHALVTHPRTSGIVNPIARRLATPRPTTTLTPPPAGGGPPTSTRPGPGRGRNHNGPRAGAGVPIRPTALHALHSRANASFDNSHHPRHNLNKNNNNLTSNVPSNPHASRVSNMTTALPHRYLVSLGRLNFAEEDLIFEQNIDEETVELAHELLELAVERGEGGSVKGVFVEGQHEVDGI